MSTQSTLDRLEAESIHIFREVAATCRKPVLLYSIGKDSSVLLHLMLKAFAPGKPPFPMLHVDTTWKFREMIAFRDRRAAETGVELIVHINQDGVREGVGPFTHGAARHTEIMKTMALKQALDAHQFDAAIGGARRDEERSRAKERIFSFRDSGHHWEPRRQRPELWNVYNTRMAPGETVRVFPLSNWTELDVWRYIERESIEVVPLYFAAERPVLEHNGALIMRDDNRLPTELEDKVRPEMVRFRTLGCWPLTGGVRSTAASVADILAEMRETNASERQGRVIDFEPGASMEDKKREGYF